MSFIDGKQVLNKPIGLSAFYTTLIERNLKPQNAFIGSIPSKYKGYSSMCILGHSPA